MALLETTTTQVLESVQKRSCDDDVLGRLRTVIVLGGAVRRSGLGSAVKRSVTDLPLDPESGLTIKGHLYQQLAELCAWLGRSTLGVRVIVNRNAPEPLAQEPDEKLQVSIESDPLEWRGTGGLLRDASEEYEDEDYILVLLGGQLLLNPLTELTERMAETRGEVSMVAHRDGSSVGLMLIRCGCLRDISGIGFVDLKEQALPAIAKQHRVTVVQWPHASSMPIRTMTDYLAALRRFHQGAAVAEKKTLEGWQPRFSIVESTARVHPTARVYDSVVLGTARVERGAVLVRSVVSPGAVVSGDEVVVDRLVKASRWLRR